MLRVLPSKRSYRRILGLCAAAILSLSCVLAGEVQKKLATPSPSIVHLPTSTFVPWPESLPTATSSPILLPLPPSPTASVLFSPTPANPFTPLTGQALDPLSCIPSFVEAEYGLVSWVRDGSTLVVDVQGRLVSVRMVGIETPRSTLETTRKLLTGQLVKMFRDGPTVDRHGQWLRYVALPEGRFINFELLRHGLARIDASSAPLQCRAIFAYAEEEARLQTLGIWASLAFMRGLPLLFTSSPEGQQVSTMTPGGQLIYTSTPTENQLPKVKINNIHFDGDVPNTESDEYAVILNYGTVPVNLRNWRLNAGDAGQDFIFPNFILSPAQSCRVYTNFLDPDHCGFSFGSPTALWNNNGDCGKLYDDRGALISTFCY